MSSETTERKTSIAPTCLDLESGFKRYLMPGISPSGHRKKAIKYKSTCLPTEISSGLSVMAFPQFEQKKAVGRFSEEQYLQGIWSMDYFDSLL